MRYARFPLLLSGAALAVIALLLWLDGGGERNAGANPELTVGIDLNPSTPSTYEKCLSISGSGVTFDVDVFVQDGTDLVAFSADVEYDPTVVDIIGIDTDQFLGAQPGSDVFDTSGPLPPAPPGFYETGALDASNQGDDGSGVLARLTLQSIADNGASPFDIDSRDLDSDGDQDRGVKLTDVNEGFLNDPADGFDNDGDTLVDEDPVDNQDNDGDTLIDEDWGDGFYDGPFINAQTTIAVGDSGQTDSDGDGIPDGCDNCPTNYNPGQADTDGDGIGDTCDPDDDNDGIPDFVSPGPDNCRTTPNPFDFDDDGQDGEDPFDYADNDTDGLIDEDIETGQDDWNNDGSGDICDDSDGDLVTDYPDNCREDSNANQDDMDGDGVGDVCDPDKDGDGLDNGVDNCPGAYNPGQEDWDTDGQGDACDDSDGDLIMDAVDNCRTTPNPGQEDADTDGVGNPCDNCQSIPNPADADDDGQDGEDPVDVLDNDDDGLVDEDHETGQENLDNDALGDACDWDDENDSICDPGESSPFCTGSDNCRLVANGPDQSGLQCVGNQTDTDGDGLGDPCDPDGDSDHFSKAEEDQWGSLDCQATSLPEVCDGTDNDLDGSTDEGWGDPPTPFADIDADTVPDCTDGDVDTDGDGIFNSSDPDIDDDQTSNDDKNMIPTDSSVACDNGVGYPDWPPDFDDNRTVNILDIVLLTPPVYNACWPDPTYSKRKDLNSDGCINILDIVRVTPPVFNTSCTP